MSGAAVTPLAGLMVRALQAEAAKHIAPSTAINRRSYDCSVEGCARPAFAQRLCNAHYIRLRRGMSMDTPLASRKRAGKCVECGAPTNKNGGLGRCKKHYAKFRAATIKRVCVEALGGKCLRCKGVFPTCVFDFHHLGKKEFTIGNAFTWASMERIAQEVAGCELLCANCHRMEHNDVGV